MSKLTPKISFILLLFLLTAHQSFPQIFGFQFNQNKDRVVVPFEIYNNLIIIPVTLNEKVPLKFILDSGIRTAILTDKIITDVLQVTYNRKISIKGAGDGRLVEAYVANNVTLALPGVTGYGQALLVLDQDYLQLSRNLGTEVHGIIGYELFSRFVVDINYKARYLVLHRKDEFRLKRNFKEVPITLEDTKPYINANVLFNNGYSIHGRFLIDTGASHALLLEKKDNSNRIPAPQQYLHANLGRGLGGIIRGKIARVGYVEIDEFKFEDVIASYPDPNTYIDSLDISRDGTIGGELLRRFRFIIDYSSEMAYFKPNNLYNKSFEFNLSGMDVITGDGNYHEFVVDAVMENSPAYRAGVREGDTIEMINGHEAKNIELNFINIALNSKPGKKIRLLVRRDGEVKLIKFRLSASI